MDIVIHVILVVMAVPGQHQVIVLLVQLDSKIYINYYFFFYFNLKKKMQLS
jgi:hypothetical protein